jgi:MFS family permease
MTHKLTYSTHQIIMTLLASQALYSATNIVAFTVSSIQIVKLAGGDESWTGVPSTVMLVSAALMAYPMGKLMDRFGRRIGLVAGNGLGIIGSAVAGWGLISGSLWIMLGGIALLGGYRGAVEQGRYAAADASQPHQRGRAISLVVLGGTVGAIGGPTLLSMTTSLASRLGILPDSGPWLIGIVFAALAALIVFVFLRPDPQTIARQIAAETSTQLHPKTGVSGGRSLRELAANPHFGLAAAAMVFSQLGMVIVMTITPVYMTHHDHGLQDVAWVIMAHTLGMFGFSYFSGWLSDRFGATPIILVGGVIGTTACLIAPFSDTVAWLAAALFLLGLGWSLCYVAGSTLLDSLLEPAEKGRIQGAVETWVRVSSGSGSLGSGLMFKTAGFALTSWVTIVTAVVPTLWVIVIGLMSKRPTAAETKT